MVVKKTRKICMNIEQIRIVQQATMRLLNNAGKTRLSNSEIQLLSHAQRDTLAGIEKRFNDLITNAKPNAIVYLLTFLKGRVTPGDKSDFNNLLIATHIYLLRTFYALETSVEILKTASANAKKKLDQLESPQKITRHKNTKSTNKHETTLANWQTKKANFTLIIEALDPVQPRASEKKTQTFIGKLEQEIKTIQQEMASQDSAKNAEIADVLMEEIMENPGESIVEDSKNVDDVTAADEKKHEIPEPIEIIDNLTVSIEHLNEIKILITQFLKTNAVNLDVIRTMEEHFNQLINQQICDHWNDLSKFIHAVATSNENLIAVHHIFQGKIQEFQDSETSSSKKRKRSCSTVETDFPAGKRVAINREDKRLSTSSLTGSPATLFKIGVTLRPINNLEGNRKRF